MRRVKRSVAKLLYKLQKKDIFVISQSKITTKIIVSFVV